MTTTAMYSLGLLGALSVLTALKVNAAPLDLQHGADNVQSEQPHLHMESKRYDQAFYFEAFPNSNVPTEPVFLLMVAVFGSMIFVMFTLTTRIFSYYVCGRGVVSEREQAISNLRVVGIKDETLAETKAAESSQQAGATPSQSPDSGDLEKGKLDIDAKPSTGARKSKDANVISGPIVPVLRDEPDDESDEEEEEDERDEERVNEVPEIRMEQGQVPQPEIPEVEAPAYESVVAAAPPISDSLNYMPSYSSGAIENMTNSTSYRELQEGGKETVTKTGDA